MARASGSRWQPSYVTESSLGVPSGTAFTKTRLLLASGLEQRRSNLQSQQAVGDRSVAPGRLGNKTNTFRANGELSYGTFEDFSASACMNSWQFKARILAALCAGPIRIAQTCASVRRIPSKRTFNPSKSPPFDAMKKDRKSVV